MNQIEDQELLMSQLYPDLYTQVVPVAGETRTRRRRRKNKGEAVSGGRTRKRKLSVEQVNFLEMNFGNQHKLETERKDKLASELGLDPRQVAVWFQNRRARWKNKKLEEEYSKLKSSNEDLIMEKCHLESEVLKLKEQLSDAEKEIQRISERLDGISSSSPSSSLSIDANPHYLGEFILEELDNQFYVAENSYIHGMDWVNLFGL